jgi:hypothetical protein
MPTLPQATSLPISSPDSNTPITRSPGDQFVPYKAFPTGVFVPDVLLSNPKLSFGAKLLWARLARYGGAEGVCFPALQTLSADLGCSAHAKSSATSPNWFGAVSSPPGSAVLIDPIYTGSCGTRIWNLRLESCPTARQMCRPVLVRQMCRPPVRHMCRP